MRRRSTYGSQLSTPAKKSSIGVLLPRLFSQSVTGLPLRLPVNSVELSYRFLPRLQRLISLRECRHAEERPRTAVDFSCGPWRIQPAASFPGRWRSVLRVAITYYLIFTISAGPAVFCCCAFKAVAAPRQATASHSSPLQSGEACPRCQKHRDEQPPPAEKTPTPYRGQQDGCPCKARGGQAVFPSAVPDETRAWSFLDVSSSALALDTAGILTATHKVSTRPTISAGLRDGPWLSAGDLLTTHHIIRC